MGHLLHVTGIVTYHRLYFFVWFGLYYCFHCGNYLSHSLYLKVNVYLED